MIKDLQGAGYHLCNPEIASETLVKEKRSKSKMLAEYLLCAGNLSTKENFEREHFCNKYCMKLELTQLQEKNCILNCIPKVFYLVKAIDVSNKTDCVSFVLTM